MKFRSLFSTPKPIIGMIALPPLPGYPEFTTMSAYLDYVLRDLAALTQGGVDAVCIENDFDQKVSKNILNYFRNNLKIFT